MSEELFEVTIYCCQHVHGKEGLVVEVIQTSAPETFVDEYNNGRMEKSQKCPHGAHVHTDLIAEIGTAREERIEQALREYFGDGDVV